MVDVPQLYRDGRQRITELLGAIDPDEAATPVPACPAWTDARGVKRDFDKSNQMPLFGEWGPDEQTARSRALMEEVPRYLNAMALRGQPVLVGVVENVIQCRQWDQWSRIGRQSDRSRSL